MVPNTGVLCNIVAQQLFNGSRADRPVFRAEGHAAGFIDRIAPQHLETAMELAQQVNTNPLSVRATVRTRRLEEDGKEAQSQINALKLFLTEDFQEAAKAFTEKRKPSKFKGR